MTAQLIEGATGAHLWAETYARQLGDVFEVQEDIVRNIVGVLLVELKAAEMEAAISRRTILTLLTPTMAEDRISQYPLTH